MQPGSSLDSPPQYSWPRRKVQQGPPPAEAGPSTRRPPQPPQTQSTQRPRTPPSPTLGPRRSERLRRVPTRHGNVYGESRHPAQIERDTTSTKTWKALTESEPNSLDNGSSEGSFHEAEGPPPHPSPPQAEEESSGSLGERSEHDEATSSGTDSHDEVEHALSHLVKQGGVQMLNALLANAIPPASAVPDTRHI